MCSQDYKHDATHHFQIMKIMSRIVKTSFTSWNWTLESIGVATTRVSLKLNFSNIHKMYCV
jgi:hypothetical protein